MDIGSKTKKTCYILKIIIMKKNDLFEYLDGYYFVNESEVNMAVFEFFMENMWIMDPSYWELLEYWELASEYIKEKKLNFSEN